MTKLKANAPFILGGFGLTKGGQYHGDFVKNSEAFVTLATNKDFLKVAPRLFHYFGNDVGAKGKRYMLRKLMVSLHLASIATRSRGDRLDLGA